MTTFTDNDRPSLKSFLRSIAKKLKSLRQLITRDRKLQAPGNAALKSLKNHKITRHSQSLSSENIPKRYIKWEEGTRGY